MGSGWRVVAGLALLGAAIGAVLSYVFWEPLRQARGLVVESVERADEIAQLGSPDGLAAWILAHPESVALVTYEVGANGEPLTDRPMLLHRADAVHPIASLAKVGVAAAWALAIHDGRREAEAPVDPREWDARWLPGTDGGAHERAIATQKHTVGDTTPIPESRLVGAMIRWSDNAATDWLTDTLGREALVDIEQRGLGHATTVHNLLGAFLLWTEIPAATLLSWSDDEELAARRVRADAWIAGFDGTVRTSPALPPIADQAQLSARFGPQGRAADYAAVFAGIVTGTWPTPAAATSIDKVLSWPMMSEASQARFARFGAKGGALPGVVTDAFYVQLKESPHPRVVVLFLKDLPLVGWGAMMGSFVHQEFMLSLVDEPARVDALAAALRGELPAAD